MSPELAKNLLQIPEVRQLCAFFLSEADKLNVLDDISSDNLFEIAVETKSRQKAYKTLMEMLSPLLDNTQFGIMKEKDDSISTEMLQDERSSTSNQD